MLILWIIFYTALSLFSFGCTIFFLLREDYGGMALFLVIGIFTGILAYSTIQGRRAEQGKVVKESKIAGRFIQIFFFLISLVLGLGGIGGGIMYIIIAKNNFDYAYGVFGILIGWSFLSSAFKSFKKAKQAPGQGAIGTKAKAGKSRKKIILIVAGAIIIIILAAVFLASSSFTKKTGPALQEFDFPVWTLRQGDITVFQQEKYFEDSSERNIVVGNAGEQEQQNIKINQIIPLALAENADDLSFSVEPKIIRQSDPVALEFEIEKIAPQKSAVIKISSKNNFSRMQELCSGANIKDCVSHTQELAYVYDEETRTKYQSQAEPVFAVYSKTAPNLSETAKQFIAQVEGSSEKAILSQEQAGGKNFFTTQGEKIYEFVAELVDKIKELSGIETTKKSEPPKSTNLTENFFAKNFTQAWVLVKTESVSAENIICRAAAPLKAMNAKYEIPAAYLKGATASKRTSQIVQISVFDSMENRDKALKGCTGQDARIASGYRVEIKFRDQMGFDVKRFMAVQDNYLIVVPGTAGPSISYVAPAWDELFFKQTVLPAMRVQIKANY